jgi:hypothetical protein
MEGAKSTRQRAFRATRRQRFFFQLTMAGGRV